MEVLEHDRADQLWKKGEQNIEGYFLLENSEVSRVMTACSSRGLEIKGNISLR